MPEHNTILHADTHEPRHITPSVTADSGKVITPSSTLSGTSDLRLLQGIELGFTPGTAGQVLAVNSGATALEWVPNLTYSGQMDITNNATPQSIPIAIDTTLATFSDYVKLVGFAGGTLDKLTFATNEMTIPAGGGGKYLITTYLNVSSDTNNSDVAIKFAVNGASGVARRPRMLLSTLGEKYNLAGSGIVQLAGGDVVSLYIASDKAILLTVQDCAVTLHKLGE